jgi:hypothetical protein
MKREILKKIALLLALISITFYVQAQVTIGAEKAPETFSILELVSGDNNGGLRLPQIESTDQRDVLFTNAVGFKSNPLAIGLQIFNMETNCIEYWSGEEWISLCQGSLNPEVEIPIAACNSIRVYGKYYKNAPLNNTHYIVLPVTVTRKGNYNIIATSSNGYYFQASGVFEETGTFQLRLDGMGTPGINQTDQIALTCNNAPIGMACDITINVEALAMGYNTDCDSIKVFGSYQTRRFMNNDNYVKVPIEVLQTGNTQWETNTVNGIKFVCNRTLDVYGPDTLILRAQGSPKQSGKYIFTFTTDGSIKTTCSFAVDFISTLGTFNDPACKCLDIYEERPDVSNGEYWLVDCISSSVNGPIKTFCDIENGGWTLVWSFSENVARNTYSPTGFMTIQGSIYSAFNDLPLNKVTTETGTIDYSNFRLSRNEWRNFPNSTARPQLKVRITNNPTNMNDEWALNNYGIISPRNISENPIETNFADYRLRVPAEGKIFGKRWKVDPNIAANYGGWDEVSGNRGELVLYSSTGYCTHWNFGNLGSATPFQVFPNPGGLTGTANQIGMNNINNSFGWFGEVEVNHHFGKCNSGGDDYSFATPTCGTASLYPHSFNGGQGRYLQWFVR